MIQDPTQMQPDQQDPSAVKPPAQPKIPQTPLVNPAPSTTAPTIGAAAPPMTPPAATPTQTPVSQTPLTNPAANAPTIAPATPSPASMASGGGADTPAGYTYDAAAQGWNVPAGQVTAGAANNPIGNAAFQWVVDPVTGAYAKKGTENTVDASGMAFDASGKPMDLPGSTHTYTYDQQQGTPVQESFQRAGVNGATSPAMSGDGHGGGVPAIGPATGSPLPTGGDVPRATDTTSASGQSLGGYVNASGDSAPTQSPLLAAAAGDGVNLSTLDPNNDLRSQTVLPGGDPSRLDLANNELQNYENQQLPQFRNKLRSTFQNNAALGRNGSGMLRTDVGNLDLAEQSDLNAKKTSLLDAAMGDTITDNRNNRNEVRTERDRQDALENQSYNRGVQGVTLEDALQNSALGRGLAQFNAGQSGNPAQMQLLLSQIFGQQATGAGQALSGMVKGNASNGVLTGQGGGSSTPSSTGNPSDLMGDPSQWPDWLRNAVYPPTDQPSDEFGGNTH